MGRLPFWAWTTWLSICFWSVTQVHLLTQRLGCTRRVVQQQILDANGWEGHKGWAFGLGLERLAMVKFQIDDIRLFWSCDQRFLSQFRAGNLGAKFKPYSKYPPVFKVRPG